MNLNEPKHPWSRLTTAARPVTDDRAVAPPFGFATRVAALAMAQERKIVSLFERFAVRALCAACLLALVSVAVNYPALGTPIATAVDETTEDDPVAVLLDT